MVSRDEARGEQLSKREFSFGYWLNGYRKNPDDQSSDHLCFETGFFGLALNLADLRDARFGPIVENLDYVQALRSGVRRMRGLKPTTLDIEVVDGDHVYRATHCEVGEKGDRRRLDVARMWESGKLVQHYDLQNLVLEDAEGKRLGCKGSLDIVVWPQSLTLTANLSPEIPYADGAYPGMVGNGHCVINKSLEFPHDPKMEPTELTLECWVKSLETTGNRWILAKNHHEAKDGCFGFMLNQGRVTAVMNIGGGHTNKHVIEQKGGSFEVDGWNHLAMSYDGNEMQLFINGKGQGSEKIDGPRVPGDGVLRVGQRPDGRGDTAKVMVDQIRIWNRALSKQEILASATDPKALPSREGLSFEQTFDSSGEPPILPPEWKDVTTRIRMKTPQREWDVEKTHPGVWTEGDSRGLSLTCGRSTGAKASLSVQASVGGKQTLPVTFDPTKNCFVANVANVKRNWRKGPTDIRNYDEFDLVVDNGGNSLAKVPFLLDLRDVANITGLCPILCDSDGVPTGIPVQVSKNWHEPTMGAYLRAYAQLPAAPGKTTYKLRIAYGFYGTLPSASHAQLSLVGYGGNGRWEQLAIGCWGETFCMDLDMSCVDVAITDVRMLMARNGPEGKKWNWTDGGWGGDWLSTTDDNGQKLFFSEMKTAYLAHGPCLTEVRYDGNYGSQREVGLQAMVRTLRTDDYARTFHTLRYEFQRQVPADKGWLFKMGRTGHLVTPTIAYGNGSGLTAEMEVPKNRKPSELVVDRVTLEGNGPWWVGFPGAYFINDKDWGTGSRALVIRSYRAILGGKTYTRPTISMPVNRVQPDGRLDLDLLLAAPGGVSQFQPGDSVAMDLEWITLPRVADDYYGPNEAFRKHLEDNPRSWKTVFREAKGNDLRVKVSGGKLAGTYPVIVQTSASETTVEISGGVGMVPIRFEGLASAKGYALYQDVDGKLVQLDQSVHGNDFWQTDFDAQSGTFKLSYNLPLNGLENSKWILKRKTLLSAKGQRPAVDPAQPEGAGFPVPRTSD